MMIQTESEHYGVCSVMSFMQNVRHENISDRPSGDVLILRKRNLNMPTKDYIDNVIEKALTNIKNGKNIPENRRILNIFSNIAGENPAEKELKAYIG